MDIEPLRPIKLVDYGHEAIFVRVFDVAPASVQDVRIEHPGADIMLRRVWRLPGSRVGQGNSSGASLVIALTVLPDLLQLPVGAARGAGFPTSCLDLLLDLPFSGPL